MANRLNYNDLLKYMEIVLDMEKNVYVELKSWQDLQGQINRLGIPQKYTPPCKIELDGETIGGIIAGIVVSPFVGGGIGAIILAIVTIVRSISNANEDATWMLYIPIVLGILAEIVYIIMIVLEKKRDNNYYKDKVNEYNQYVANNQARVQRELVQKRCLQKQANIIATMWQKSKERLDEIYRYDILEEKYRNIVAVASIYEYLKHERTRSLQRIGSDEGAYNKFESEVRLNKIITNTDIIIQKLDVVIENQRELANTMKNAQNSINNLVTSINNMSARLQSGMEQFNASAELSNYQQQQTNNELRYMNFMNTLHFYI